MSWIAENWIWVLFGLAFVAMHLFGHGSHGGRSRGFGHGDPSAGSSIGTGIKKNTTKQAKTPPPGAKVTSRIPRRT